MWVETIDENMVNLANATGIQTSQKGETYKVHAEVIVQHQSRTSLREIYRGDEDGFDAFIAELKDALPMLPIGEHKPKSDATEAESETEPTENRIKVGESCLEVVLIIAAVFLLCLFLSVAQYNIKPSKDKPKRLIVRGMETAWNTPMSEILSDERFDAITKQYLKRRAENSERGIIVCRAPTSKNAKR